jgi:hypothetical protein
MRVLRNLLFPILAAILAGCAATTPLHPAQVNDATEMAEPEPDPAPTAEVTAEVEKPKPPAPKPATAATAPRKGTTTSTTPNVGSPEWKKERAENERKEQHIKEVIDGICTGC